MAISANSGSLCRVTLTRGFWFADLESGDGFGGRAAGLGQQLVAVVDAEGMVGGLDGSGFVQRGRFRCECVAVQWLWRRGC
jgi:hypothetical protein